MQDRAVRDSATAGRNEEAPQEHSLGGFAFHGAGLPVQALAHEGSDQTIVVRVAPGTSELR